MQYVGAGGEGDAGASGAKALGAEQVHLVVGYPERHLGDVGGACVYFYAVELVYGDAAEVCHIKHATAFAFEVEALDEFHLEQAQFAVGDD